MQNYIKKQNFKNFYYLKKNSFLLKTFYKSLKLFSFPSKISSSKIFFSKSFFLSTQKKPFFLKKIKQFLLTKLRFKVKNNLIKYKSKKFLYFQKYNKLLKKKTFSNFNDFSYKKYLYTRFIFRNINIISLKITLNNIYITITDFFGNVKIYGSSGMLDIKTKFKPYLIELLTELVCKKLIKNSNQFFILKTNRLSKKQKKIGLKVFQKYQMKILFLVENTSRPYNGTRKVIK